jgi:hypothetical protein
VTDDQGRFVLHYDQTRDGAVPGLHTVFVTYKPSGCSRARLGKHAYSSGRFEEPSYSSTEALDATRGKMAPDLIHILAKYGHQDSSPLKVLIESETPDIRLDLN